MTRMMAGVWPPTGMSARPTIIDSLPMQFSRVTHSHRVENVSRLLQLRPWMGRFDTEARAQMMGAVNLTRN